MNDYCLFYYLIPIGFSLFIFKCYSNPYINARCERAPLVSPVSPYKDPVVAAARTSDNVLVYCRLIMSAAVSIK